MKRKRIFPTKAQLRSWSLPSKYSFWGLILTIISLLITIGSVAYCVRQRNFEIRSERYNANVGNIDGPQVGDYEEFELNFGGMSTVLSREELQKGVDIKNTPKFIQCGSIEPFKLKSQEKELVISAKFFDLKNQIVSEIQDNEWRTNKNNYYKRNYDSKAIEVIDNFDIVRMQIEVIDSLIRINGVIDCGGTILIGKRGSTAMLGTTDEAKKLQKEITGKDFIDLYLEKCREIQPIFSYKGENWLGERIFE